MTVTLRDGIHVVVTLQTKGSYNDLTNIHLATVVVFTLQTKGSYNVVLVVVGSRHVVFTLQTKGSYNYRWCIS